MNRAARCVVALSVAVTVQAAAGGLVPIDDWNDYPLGALPLTAPSKWSIYSSMPVFKQPPAIVVDNGRRALRLKTDRETMAIGRTIHADIAMVSMLVWEWKPLVLPAGGDVRQFAVNRNDQAARLVLWFDAPLFGNRRAIGYIWDSNAPVGEIVRQRDRHTDRALLVVRSGSTGLGRWHRETRHVYEDYRRIFREEPADLLAVTLESHSDDVKGESAVLFGTIRLQPK